MKKNLLVTLADRNWIDQAKQLFSSAYWNAGWKGDYMLLAHDIPEKDLKWFRDKGILIKKCRPQKEETYGGIWSAITLSKFSLFTPEFKKWDHVLFVDADIIIRRNLDRLTKTNGFSAAKTELLLIDYIKKSRVQKTNRLIPADSALFWQPFEIKYEDYIFQSKNSEDSKLYLDLEKKYVLTAKTFNSGVMVFDTKIIKKGTSSKLKKLAARYGPIIRLGEETIFNLAFFNEWEELPATYNVNPFIFNKYFYQSLNKIDAAVLHFYYPFRKPWDKRSQYFSEWGENLARAEDIDLKNLPSIKPLTRKDEQDLYDTLFPSKITKISREFFVKLKRAILLPIFLLGKVIKKISPRFYHMLGGKN